MAGSGFLNQHRAKKLHLIKGKGGVAGEVWDLRQDLESELSDLVALTVEQWDNVATSDVDAIKASVASAASEQTYTGTDLDGVVGEGTMSPPRNIIITTSTHADIDAVDVVITGLDIDGNAITETITLTDGGGQTETGAKAFASVTSIVVPAQGGTGGALEFGFGTIIGLSKTLTTRAGAGAILAATEAGTYAAPAAGTIAVAGTGAPHGTYDPSAAPNGTNDYAVWYEYDL